jgi:phospholipid/cholesterol/gamma-HCH transport system substrate-binding protein
METKANYAIVGFFTLVVVLMAFGFVYWMSVYGRAGKLEQLIVRIPGSANGLSVGSPVRFNGIPIGTVRALDFDRHDPAYSLAVTEIRVDSPVYPTTRAVLEVQGFTGAAYIEFSGGNPKDEPILVTAQKAGRVATINARQSGVTNIVATASEIANKTDKILVTLQGFVNENRKPLTDTISNIDVFTRALKNNAPGIDKLLESVSSLSGTIKNVSGRLDTTLAAAEKLINSVDSKKIDDILANAQKVSSDLANASGKVGGIVDEVHLAVKDAGAAVKNINDTVATYKTFGERATASLDKVDKLIAAVDPQKVQGTVDDIRTTVADASKTVKHLDEAIATYKTFGDKASVSLDKVDKLIAAIDPQKVQGSIDDIRSAVADARTTIANFKGVSQDIDKRRGDIDKTITNVAELSANLNKSSIRVDGVIDKVDTLIAAVDPKKVQGSLDDIRAAVADARTAVGNFKGVSQDIDKHRADIDKTITNITELSANLNKSSTRVDGVITKVDNVLVAIDPKKVQGALDDIRAAVADARTAISNFKGVSQDVDKRRADIDSTISNISEMSAKLNKASTRVDGVLAKVDSFLGTGDSKSLFADARATLKSFKEVADNLNARIGPIADNLTRFSGSGLKNIDALVDDTRRTMNTLNQAITRFDSDPQRLLFGGQDVKQFDGRTRR